MKLHWTNIRDELPVEYCGLLVRTTDEDDGRERYFVARLERGVLRDVDRLIPIATSAREMFWIYIVDIETSILQGMKEVEKGI